MANMGDKLIDLVEEISWWVASGMKQHLADYVEVETADSKHTLVLKDGSLMSILRVNGSRHMVGADEFRTISAAINNSFESTLSESGGHAVQVFFQHDHELVERQLRNLYEPSIVAAENMGFSIADIVEDRVMAMEKLCHVENCFFVLKTSINAISASDRKRSSAQQSEAVKRKKGAIAILAQNPIVAIDGLRDRHSSFVTSFLGDINDVGLMGELLTAHEACREIRNSIDPEFTDEKWQPSLVGDRLPARIPNVDRDDISAILWPKLSYQLTPRSGKAIDHRFFQIGNRIYGSVSIDLPPKDPKFFNMLFSRMVNSKIPWRSSFNIESGGLKSIALKRTMAAIIGFMHSGNALIVDAYKELESDVRRLGVVDAKVSMCFTTWVSDGNLQTLSSRVSALARAVEGWGVCEVNEIPGDSAAGFMSTVLGQSSGGVAVPCAANLKDVVSMLPITRPSSPWSAGSLMFRTPDGKIWPYQPGSSKQAATIDLFFAGMGSGKSVLMNGVNLALCTDPRIKRLPRIGILDIGVSSEGLIRLLQDQLPEGRKHEAAYHRLRMTPECAINPFDTNLGCRYPLASHRAFLCNFLLLLATPVGKTSSYDGISDMVGIAVDETYKRLSDDYSPRPYSPGVDEEVDQMIAQLDIKIDKKATWWEIVDDLYKAGKTRHAGMAQRYAVPILDDVIESARSEQIRDTYNMTTSSNETLVGAFSRMISSSIREYSIISKPTKFDISEARVISLDLDEVAKTGGDAADRQTAVMYMLGRFVLARDYYLIEDNLKEMPENYRNYHRARIKDGSEDIKRICIDEFHRTKRVQAVRDQVVTDIREGRKWGVHVALASQNLDDFDDIMISLSTSVFIMGKFDQKDVKNITERFGLGHTASYALENNTHGPRPGVGTTFLVNMVTTDSNQKTTQLVTSTIGPIEYWTFSTTAEDKILRSMMYDRLGGTVARKVLSTSFPWGIKKEVERRAEMLSNSSTFEEDRSIGIIDSIYKELIEKHQKDLVNEQHV